MSKKERELTFTEVARRTQILQATTATINKLGYERTSLSEIAKEAGVAKSAIVYYFGSKETLLMSVLEHAFGALGTNIESAVALVSSPGDKLLAYARNYLDFIDQHRAELAAAVTIVVAHRTEDGKPLYLMENEDDTALLQSILSAGMDEGAFRRMPVSEAAKICEALLDMAITAVQRNLDADLTILKSELVDFIVSGLSPVSQ